MTKSRFAFIGLFTALALSAAAFSTAAMAYTKPAETEAVKNATRSFKDYGDWRVGCPEGAKAQQCEMFQHILFGGTKKNALSTFVHTQDMKDKGTVAVITLVTPLGTLLPAGLSLKIDDGKDLKVPFIKCEPAGCIVTLVFDDKAINTLKNGKTLTVSYMSPAKKDFPMKVSLKGFSQAYSAIGGK